MNGIKYVRPGGGFEPNMTLFKKTDVNGADENPIFTFLKVTFTHKSISEFFEIITTRHQFDSKE